MGMSFLGFVKHLWHFSNLLLCVIPRRAALYGISPQYRLAIVFLILLFSPQIYNYSFVFPAIGHTMSFHITYTQGWPTKNSQIQLTYANGLD